MWGLNCFQVENFNLKFWTPNFERKNLTRSSTRNFELELQLENFNSQFSSKFNSCLETPQNSTIAVVRRGELVFCRGEWIFRRGELHIFWSCPLCLYAFVCNCWYIQHFGWKIIWSYNIMYWMNGNVYKEMMLIMYFRWPTTTPLVRNTTWK